MSSNDSISHRQCNVCNASFPLTSEYFHRDKKAKARQWHGDHREYANDYHRRYYAENKERVHKPYKERNAEYIAKRKREWRKNNPEMVARYKRDSDRRHPESVARRQMRWRKRHPERDKAIMHRRIARKRNAGGTFNADDLERQLRAQTDRKGVARCWWCGKPLGDDKSIDHRIPLAKGGSNDAGNIVIAHLKCNMSKNDKLPHEWNGRLL